MAGILVLGATGLLGSSLVSYLQAAHFSVFAQSRRNGCEIILDPLDTIALVSTLSSIKPDVIINLVAATDVDRCETDPQWAFDINVRIVLSIMSAINKSNIRPHLIHISTDQLYGGPGPHSETNISPCNVYGITKYAAELAIKDYPSTIFRTNFFGKSNCLNRKSFSDWIVENLVSGNSITVFQDVFFSALSIPTLCKYIQLAVELKICGLFNLGTIDGISKSDFAYELAKSLGLQTNTIRVGSVSDLALVARRPLDMIMNSSLFASSFLVTLPSMPQEIYLASLSYHV